MGNKEDRAAEKAAMQAEMERLCRLSVTALAVLILPAWEQAARRPGEIPVWLMAAYPRARGLGNTWPLDQPVEEAVQLLEQSGLLLREINSSGSSSYKLTRLGTAVLAKGTVRDHLPQRGPAW